MTVSQSDSDDDSGAAQTEPARGHPPGEDVHTDGQYLDWAFERALARLEDGVEPEVSALIAGREHLRGEIERVVELARRAALGVGGPVGLAEAARRPHIPGYQILAELGHGGMGVVYLAQQEKLGGRLVALKVLPAQTALSGRSRERFKREAMAIARLHHPGIVAVYDLIEESGNGARGRGVQAFAMEWVEGRSLGELIEGVACRQRDLVKERTSDAMETMDFVREMLDAPPRSDAAKAAGGNGSSSRGGMHAPSPGAAFAERSYVRWVCRVGASVARALDAVHRAGMLHRDVKPSNVLIRRDGAALLSDFGLVSDDSATITQAGQFAGTLAYASPEQLRGEMSSLDAGTDIYALGATLYHALAMRPPIDLTRGVDGAGSVLADLVVPLRQAAARVPMDLSTIIGKAMNADRARRYATAGEFADDLERFLAMRPIHARPAGVVTRARKLAMRNRVTLAASILTLLATLVVVGGAVFWIFVRPPMMAVRLEQARAEAIATAPVGSLFNKEFWGMPSWAVPERDRNPATSVAALVWYDRAIALAPLDTELRKERAVVRAARRAFVGDSSIDPREGELAGKEVVDYLARWKVRAAEPRDESAPATGRIAPPQLDGLSMDALRLVGLAAFLVSDADTAESAWARVDVDRDPGELAEAGLGLLYLIRDQPARAYPRLRRAADAFHSASNLQLDAAEAAVRCGDVEKGAALIERAQKIGIVDHWKFERVRILWQLRSGRDVEGMARYKELWVVYNTAKNIAWSAVLGSQVGEWLLEQGRVFEACEVLGQSCTEPYPKKVLERLGPTCDRWWAQLSAEEKAGCVRRVMDQQWKFGLGSEARRLLGYAAARANGFGVQSNAPTELDGVVSRLGMTQRAGDMMLTLANGWRWSALSASEKDAAVGWVLSGLGREPNESEQSNR